MVEYRDLGPDEILVAGDEWYSTYAGGWVATTNAGKTAAYAGHRYRRAITPEISKQEDILEEALRITGGDRQNQYGPPDQDFRRVAGMMNALFADKLKEGQLFEPYNIAQMMILMKMSRQLHQRKRDNWVDTAGYARCGQLCDECDAKKGQDNA